MATLETLEIVISSQSAEAKKNIDGLVKSLAKLKAAMNFKTDSANNGMDVLINRLQKLQIAIDKLPNKKLEHLADIMRSLAQIHINARGVESVSRAIDGVSVATEQTADDVGTTVSVTLDKVAEKIDDTADKAKERLKDIGNYGDVATIVKALPGGSDAVGLANSITQLLGAISKISGASGEAAGATTEMAGAAEGATAATTEMTGATAGLAEGLGTAGLVIMAVVVKFKMFLGIAKAVFTVLKGIASISFKAVEIGVKAVGTVAKTVLSPLVSIFEKLKESIGSGFDGIKKKIQNLFASLTRVAFYRLIRTVLKEITQGFKEGIDNAYAFSSALNGSLGGEFAKNLDAIYTSLLYLKNALGALVAPIINAVAPAIDFLVDKFVALLNVVNEAIAVLTGQSTWIKAIKYPYTYADAAGKATAANEKLKRSILGFDELNPLNDKNTSGSGGSGFNANASKMFEVEETDTNSMRGIWLNNLKEYLKEGDFFDAGRNLGSIVWRGIINGLATFNSRAVQDKIFKYVTGAFDFVGGFLKEGLAEGVSSVFATSVNSLFGSISLISGEISDAHIGKNLGKMFAEFIGNLNPRVIGESIASVLDAAAYEVGEFFAGMIEVTKNAPYADIGEQIAIGLNEAFRLIDYKAIARPFYLGMNYILASTSSFIKKFSFADAVKTLTNALKEFLSNVNWSNGDNSVGGVLAGLFNSALNGIMTAIDNFPVFETADALFGTIGEMVRKINWTGSGGVSDTLSSFLVKAFEFFAQSVVNMDLSTLAQNLAATINDTITKVDWFSIGQTLNEFFNSLLDGLASFIETIDAKEITSAIGKFFDGLDTDALKSKLHDIIGGVIKGAFDGLVGLAGNSIGAMVRGVADKLSGIGLSALASPLYTFANKLSGSSPKSNAKKSEVLVDPFGTKNKDLFKADGGFVSQGSAFIAGEVPGEYEFVGDINGRTGVVSGREISGIGDAIRNGTAVLASLLTEGNSYARVAADKEYNPVVRVTDINDAQSRNNRRLGTTVAALAY